MAQINGIAPASSGNGGDDGDGSPFDALRREDDYGQEYWSARDLQPLMGYDKWENFLRVIERAIRSAENTGTYSDQSFSRTQENVPGGGPAKVDYRLSRQAAYLVAMNGEPNKPAVAAAQSYFTVQTRKAEIATSRPMSELEMAKQYVAALEREQQLAKELEVAAPKAGKWDKFLNSDGLIGMTELADLLGTDVRTMTNWLVEIRIFRKQVSAGASRARNLPRKAFQDGGQFCVRMQTANGFTFPAAYATAHGLDLIDDLWRQKHII